MIKGLKQQAKSRLRFPCYELSYERKIFATEFVKNELGVFEISSLKRFCHNEYRFVAKQIGVRVGGSLHYTNRQQLNVRIPCKLEPFREEEPRLTIHTEIIELKKFYASYKGYISHAKLELRMFCRHIEERV